MLNYILLQSASSNAGGSGLVNILIIVGIIVVFYFFMIRPQSKRQKEIKKFREALTVNSRVMTAGGIHGKIKKVGNTTFVVEIAPNVAITVEKTSVYPVGDNPQQGANEKVDPDNQVK